MRRLMGAAAAAALLAACTSNGSTPSEPTTASSAASSPPRQPHRAAYGWPTYHGDNRRSGVSRGPALHPPLKRAWTKELDGAVYAQPLVVESAVIVATENNTVYSLDGETGSIRWRLRLGAPARRADLPCGNIDPLGITGTPAYDLHTGLLFVVTETTDAHHTLHALDVRSGEPRWQRSLDVFPDRDRRAEQQRGALLVSDGRVYVPFGGLFGDCGDYVGYLTATRTHGTGPTLKYAVPTARAGGIWAPPGPVQAKAGTGLFVASGNGAQLGGRYDGSDSVVSLDARLNRTDLFAPSTWAQDNAADLDLGSMSPVVLSTTFQVVIAGKRGVVYLLPGNLGGVGGEVDTLDRCTAYGGAAAVGQLVLLPCSDGIRRLDVAGNRMRWRWQLRGVAGSPTVAGRVVYALDLDSGTLVEAALDSGRVRARLHVGDVSRFATPVPIDRFVYVGTLSGVVAVRGSS